MTFGGADASWLDPLLALLLLLAVSYAAGFVGSMMGVGGGLFLVPALLLLFGLEAHAAIAASLVAVVATTTGAATARVGEGFTNLRLGMFLEVATVVGGLVGAIVSVTVLAAHDNLLVLALAPVLVASAALMVRGRPRQENARRPPEALAERLRLGGEYVDPVTGERETYAVHRTGAGLSLAAVAGIASGLLGVGGGIFKVPGMNAFMNVPFRVAAATSTLMIGVTASAGALVYFFAGDVAPGLVAPVAIAVLFGSYSATHLGITWPRERLRWLFVGILLIAAGFLLGRGLGVFP